MIGKNVSYENPYSTRDYGSGEIYDKISDNNTDKYLVKLEDGDVKSIPCTWVTSIREKK